MEFEKQQNTTIDEQIIDTSNETCNCVQFSSLLIYFTMWIDNIWRHGLNGLINS